MKKYVNILISVFLIICIFSTSVAGSKGDLNNAPFVYVSCGNYNRYFSVSNYNYSMNRTLKKALEIAGQKASENRKAYVYVSKGKYQIKNFMRIFSNTVLLSNDAYFYGKVNMLRNGFDGDEKKATRYNGAENIIIDGGVWEMQVPYNLADTTDQRYIHTTMRFAHCKKIVVRNCTFKNNYNAHELELGGVYKAEISNCTFINDRSVNEFGLVYGKEALQIDINTKVAMPSIEEYDYTASESITIKDCLFKNKFNAMGSHHGVVGNPFMNITILNNRFENISCLGISGFYWYNTEIGNNIFENVGSGIRLYSIPKSDCKSFKNAFNYSYTDTVYTIKNSQTYIYGNKINLRNSNCIKSPYGIKLSGSVHKETQKDTNVKKGLYYFYGVYLDYSPKWMHKENIINGNTDNKIVQEYIYK